MRGITAIWLGDTASPPKFFASLAFIKGRRKELAAGALCGLNHEDVYKRQSLGYHDCMLRGIDYSNGGAKYNCGGGVITVGQADIINSIAAVKYLIYDEKKLTMDELLKALDANFEGYEDVYQMCMDAPKYGNDDERADFCVGETFTYVRCV